jgi:hypothetical protein
VSARPSRPLAFDPHTQIVPSVFFAAENVQLAITCDHVASVPTCTGEERSVLVYPSPKFPLLADAPHVHSVPSVLAAIV